MDTINDCIEFVNQQIDYQDRRAVMVRGDNKKLAFHIDAAKRFRALLQFLESVEDNTTPKPVIGDINPTAPLLPKELLGLPKELIEELSAKGTDSQEILIADLIESAGGTLSLDRILIGIYNKTGEIMKRPVITAKLYRMIQKQLVYSVPKKKGIYTTISLKQSETKNVVIDWSQNKEKLS